MDPQSLKAILDCLFDRIIIAISYKAANKLAQHLTTNGKSVLDPTFVILSLSVTVACFLLFSASFIQSNECMQNTFAILLSKLVVYILIPMEGPSFLVLACIAFYLVFCITLCRMLRQLFLNTPFQMQWDLIVPYVAVACTSSILDTFKSQTQLHFLYFLVICYLLWASDFDRLYGDKDGYYNQFIDSIMSTGITLVFEDYVFGKIHKADMALSFFYMCILVCTNVVLRNPHSLFDNNNKDVQQTPEIASNKNKQLDLCMGVLIYSFSSHILQVMQSYCAHQLTTTFAVIASLFMIVLYKPHVSTSVTEFCINAFSILWTGILDMWMYNFYQFWEPLLIYLLVFIFIQALRDSVFSVLEVTSSVLLANNDKNLNNGNNNNSPSYNNNNNKEIALIAIENASTLGQEGMSSNTGHFNNNNNDQGFSSSAPTDFYQHNHNSMHFHK